jgi:hypothetical protein
MMEAAMRKNLPIANHERWPIDPANRRWPDRRNDDREVRREGRLAPRPWQL